VLGGADVAVNLIAAGVPHRREFVDFAFVFALAYGRVIVRQLANLARLQQIQP
jgi:hypothetical protein